MATLKEGYLHKYSSGIFKGWKNRYFILYNDGHLVIYDNKGGPKAASYLISRDCRDIQVGAGIPLKIPQLPDHHSVDCVFLFVARDKKFLLSAANRRELDSWLQALNSFRGNLSTNQSSYPIAPSVSYPTSATNPHYTPQNPTTPYPSAPLPSQPQFPPGGTSLGFEHLNIGNGNPSYPPQPTRYYPPFQQPTYHQPPSQNYPPQPPRAYFPPPTQPYASYPQYSGYQQPVGNVQSPYGPQSSYGQQSSYGPQPSYGPQSSYGPQPSYGPQSSYGQQPGPSYHQPQAYQQQQPYKSKSGGLSSGLGGLMGGGLGNALGMAGKKGKKHKKILGGTAAALAGGYVLHKATRRGSWGSWGSGSWGSGGSFGSFGSFGS